MEFEGVGPCMSRKLGLKLYLLQRIGWWRTGGSKSRVLQLEIQVKQEGVLSRRGLMKTPLNLFWHKGLLKSKIL